MCFCGYQQPPVTEVTQLSVAALQKTSGHDWTTKWLVTPPILTLTRSAAVSLTLALGADLKIGFRVAHKAGKDVAGNKIQRVVDRVHDTHDGCHRDSIVVKVL